LALKAGLQTHPDAPIWIETRSDYLGQYVAISMITCHTSRPRKTTYKPQVVDHIVPLECGGADVPSNMQWQTVQEAKIKDRTERNCRRE
jgi:hypothetical protein